MLCTILLLFCVVESFSFEVPIINDHDFSLKKESLTGFGVILLPAEDDEIVNQSLQALQTASATLKKHGTNLGVLDCKVSHSDLCSSHPTEILLFRNGKMVADLQADEIKTQNEAEGKILHLLNDEAMIHIKNMEQWVALKNKCAAKCNMVIAYVNGIGSQFHSSIIQSALQWINKIQFAYITDYEIASETMPHAEKIDQNGAIWISMCSSDLINNECPLVEFHHHGGLKETLESIWDRPLVNFIDGDEEATVIYNHIKKLHEEGSEVFLFVAGKGKWKKAKLLATHTCAMYFLSAECILVNGDVHNGFSSKVVKSNRIHLTILHQGGDIGASESFLISEIFEEVKEKYSLVTGNKPNQDHESEENENNGETSEDDTNDHSQEISSQQSQTIQDDPVAFTVHSSRKLVDLYLYDHKTLSRLTDVTYPEIVNGTEYAVVLFTLEFNPKSLAALSNFAIIHKDYTRKKLKSPLHRVECFDWPDICKKENINTFPRMFFYRPNEARIAYEYTGLWSESDMAKTITLYSMPWPITGLQHDLLESIPEDSDMIIGIIGTEKGDVVFKKAARRYGSQTVFLTVKDGDAKIIADAGDIADWKGKNYLLRSVNGQQLKHVAFTNFSGIEQYMDSSSVSHWTKLTISNYDSMLNVGKPLVIQFVNQSSPEVKTQTSLSKKLEEMALKSEINLNVLFTWMDSSPGTTGEYILQVYSEGKTLPLPVAFVNKQKNLVNMMSSDKVETQENIKAWIERCVDDNEEVSFTFRDDVWGPRIPGYDYLLFMKNEGTYPVTDHNSREKMEKQPIKSARLHARQSSLNRQKPKPLLHTEL